MNNTSEDDNNYEKQLMALEFVKQKVFEKYKINLDLELKIIGETVKNE